MTAATSTPDRGRAALKKLVDLLLPELAGHVPWTYEVMAVYPGPPVTLDLKAMAANNPFGTTLGGVTLWPGPDGGVALPNVGKLVIVRFNDAVAPAVCGLDPTDTPTIVYQYGTVVQIGDATAVPLAKALSVENLIVALTTFATSCEGSIADPVLEAAATALLSALTPITATVPTLKALGT